MVYADWYATTMIDSVRGAASMTSRTVCDRGTAVHARTATGTPRHGD